MQAQATRTRNGLCASWQRGYGAFSVSQSHVDTVVFHIQNQEEHHRIVTYEEEFRLPLGG
jgi:hypothetical protein